jgi:Ca2+-binding RTX toxin-like protein
MSSTFVTGLSYVNTSGAGGSINVSSTSPTGLRINRSQEVFVPGSRSNRSTVVVRNSFTTDNGNDLLLGGQGNSTFVGNLGTDIITRDTDGSLFLGRVTTSASGRANVIGDYNVSLGDSFGIIQNKNLLNSFSFVSSNSIGDDQFNSSVQSNNSFLGGVDSFNF